MWACLGTGLASFYEITNMNTQKPLAILTLAALLALFTGCASNQAMTKTAITTLVTVGVSVGSQESPTAVPYIRAAGAVVCATAAGTNVSPAAVTAALQASQEANAVKTVEGVAIVNGAVAVYNTAWILLGSNTNNLATLRDDLQGVCDGITLGLPASGASVKMLTVPRVK